MLLDIKVFVKAEISTLGTCRVKYKFSSEDFHLTHTHRGAKYLFKSALDE
jgi:hypothetical protein